ncbi:exonuclease domain-containing protein [Arsukibacterium sp.]|uniref:exonuclease domain-containing protein n=1 Tax=Arsukibacterium sp. TaxID=1977258 RepID=UPI002FD89C33
MLNWLRSKAPPIHQLINQFNTTPLPATSTPVKECRFLAIDLEMTGLNAKDNHIVSIGWVPIAQGEIVLSQAKHYLVHTPGSVGQSAVFHGVHDKHLKNAIDLPQVLEELLSHYAGYIFVAHHSQLDQRFLQVACQRHFGRAPKFKFIDTLNIELKKLQQQGTVMTTDALRLPQCLKRHHLPQGQLHHALEDAYGCALLLLSQMKKGKNQLTLSDLLIQAA